MFSRNAAALAAIAILTACADSSTTAPPERPQYATVVQKSPIAGTLTHPCTLEQLTYEGQAHFVTRTKTKGDVTTIAVTAHTANTHGVGVTSGLKYVLVENVHQLQELSATPPFPFTAEQTVRDRWQSQGGADNFFQTTTIRVTFDGTDTNTEIVKQDVDCKG